MIDREWLSDEEVESIATETEDAGHGWAGNVKTISHHGFFSPEALRHFVNQLSSAVAKKAAQAEREACARINAEKSDRLGKEAEQALKEGDRDTCISSRAAAHLLSVCSARIRARGTGGEV